MVGAVVQGATVANAVCDEVYVGGKNGESSELAAGSLVCVDTTAADGITFKLPATANVGMPLGILTEAVPAGQYTAKIKRRGVVNAFVLGHAQLAVGTTLKAVAGQRYVTLSAAAYTPGDSAPMATALVAYTTTSEGTKSIWIGLC